MTSVVIRAASGARVVKNKNKKHVFRHTKRDTH